MTKPRRATFVAVLLLLPLLAVVAACTTIERPRHPRPPLPLPPELVARYALPGPVEAGALAPIGGVHDSDFYRGTLRCGPEEIDFHYLLPKPTTRHPLVVLLPILGGGEELLWLFAGALVPKGYAVAWARRVGAPLRPGQRSEDLEVMFRRTVVQHRALLDWARDQPEIDADHTYLIGMSTGGIVGGVMTALEPDLRGSVLILAGGDLSDLLAVSAERRAVLWRAHRFVTDGLGDSGLRRELATHLVSDPARVGAFVDTDRVMLVDARFDEVVPPRNQELLWESLGRPDRIRLPLGHYTAILALGPIATRAHEFFVSRAGALVRAREVAGRDQ